MLSAHLRNISRVIKIPGPFRVGNARVHLSIFKEFPRKRLLHQPDHSLIRFDDNSRADAAPIVNLSLIHIFSYLQHATNA